MTIQKKPYGSLLVAAAVVAVGIYIGGKISDKDEKPEPKPDTPPAASAPVDFDTADIDAKIEKIEKRIEELEAEDAKPAEQPDPPKQTSIQWRTDYIAAAKEAESSGKLLWAHCISDNCPPCIALEKNVFPDPVVVALSEKFIPFKVNIDDFPKWWEYGQDNGARGTPFDMILDCRKQPGYREIFTASGLPSTVKGYIAHLTARLN